MRTPVFELHIQPMFRLLDRDHMAFRFDLFDYDQVVAHGVAILDRLKRDMPTVDTGGLWPEEWIALFERWVQGDHRFKRLELGQGTYSITVSGARATLRASGSPPAAGYRAWLDIESETAEARSYALLLEAPDQPVPGTPAPFSLRDRFDASDMRPIYVRDASGVQSVPRSS